MLNKVILMGRICKDLELKYTPNNTPVCAFSLAVDRDRKGANGNKVTDFLDCVAWNKTAEFMRSYMCKGQLIAIVGAIQTRKWTDRNGNNRVSVEVKVDEAHFAGPKKDKAAPKSEPAAPLFDLPVSDDDFTELDDMSGVPF